MPATDPPAARVATRTTWGVLDQLMWSLGNVVLTILVASSVSGAEFGRFSAAFAIVLVVAGSAGALCFEPLVMLDAEDRGRSQPVVLRMAAAIGVGSGLLMAAASVVFTSLADVMLLLALGLPVYVVMEVLRGTLNYSGHTKLLFELDALWTALSILFLLAGRQVEATTGVLGLLWCAAALPSIAIGIRCTRPRSSQTRENVLPTTMRFGPSFVFEYLVSSGIAQLVPIVVAVAATFEAAAELRLIQVAFGPVTALFAGIRVVAMPQLRDHHRAGGDLRRTVVMMVSALAASALMYGLVLWTVDESLLTRLFGEAWPAAAALLPIAVAIRCSNAVSLAAILVARVTEHVVGSRRIRIVVGTCMVLGSFFGALHDGSRGAITGLLLAQIVGVVAWFTLIRNDLNGAAGGAT